MDILNKTTEELIFELEKLQKEHEHLKRSYEAEFQDRKYTEEALRKSEDNLFITLHSIGDAVISTDKEGLVVRMNPVAEELCGWSFEEALGKPLNDVFIIVNAVTRKQVTNPVKKVLEFGEIVGLANHTVLISRNGVEYHISDSAAPIKDKDGEITGIVLVFSDVTVNYKAQMLIKESEKRNHSLLNNLEAGIVVHAPDTSIVMNNHRASELLGLSEEQMRGKEAIDPAWNFVDEELKPLPLSEYPVNRILSGRQPIQNQILGVHHPLKKEIVWVTVNGFAVLDNQGEIVEIVISFIDISDGKKAEKELKQRELELRRQNELFESLINNLPMGVFMVDAPSGKPLVANKSALKLLGRGILPDASKQNLGEVYHAFKGDTDHPYPIDDMPILQGMNGVASYIDDMIVLKPDGITTNLEVYGSPVKDEDGTIWASLVSFTDITERKQLEDVQTFLLTCGYPGSDENFFESLAKFLSKILNSEYVCIDKLEGDGLTAQTLAIYNEGKFEANVSYTLGQTPCGDVVGKTICCFPKDVCQLFPHDDALQELKAQSYIGTTLWSYDGKPIGLIAIIGQKPMQNTAFAESVLKIVAIRAAGELERNNVEEALRENELKFRTLFETADDAIMLVCEGRWVDCNAGAMRIFGCSREEIINSSPSRFSPPTQPDGRSSKEVILNYDVLVYHDGPQVFEWEHCRLDGTTFSTEVSLNRLDFGGKSYIQAIVRDVSARKQAEIALIDSEAKYRQIFDNTFDIMAIYEVTEDHRYKVITYNAAEASLLGPIEYYQNRYIDECIPPELYNEFKQHYERCVREEHLITYEETIDFQDIKKSFYTQLIPLKNNVGRIHRIIVISRDITENKLLHDQLIDQNEKLKVLNLDLVVAKEKAEESDRLKSAFLANMSHEIRTPMNGILGFAEILQDPEISGEQQQEYLQIIQKSGYRMLNIINDIIDISKIESGLMKANFKESNINEQIEYIYTFFKPEVEAKGLKFSFKMTLTAREAHLVTDREKLYAILTNLVKNAVKFTAEGSIEFGYSFIHDPDSLLFYVKDTGIGIPKERQHAIFERFVQADISDKMAKQGAGLGLAISKSFVEMLGGKIWVESEVGVGSTFYFTVPYTIDQELMSNLNDPSLIDGLLNQSRRLNILLAEDDETSEMLMTIIVKEYSNDIQYAKTGTDAVEICRNNPNLDLILMDIRMPKLNGYDATRQIRLFNKDVVIIAQTAYGLSVDREKAIEAGCNDFIAKPINRLEFLSVLQKYFKKE